MAARKIYGHKEREPEQSINFVTCHDGFTLNDLVSYNEKHNEANGEDNRDGANDNQSWNCGVEGPSDNPATEQLRNRQLKNFLTVTLLSLGVPMIVMGDEVRRSQGGNNNAYCQDNETSWFDWTLLKKHADVHRFLQAAHNPSAAARHRTRAPADESEPAHPARRTKPGTAFTLTNRTGATIPAAWRLPRRFVNEKLLFHLILNAHWEPLDFELPPAGKGGKKPWRRWVDTALKTPNDIVPWEKAPTVPGLTYRAEARSVVVLYAATS